MISGFWSKTIHFSLQTHSRLSVSTNLSLFSGHEARLFLLWVLPIPESLGYFGHGHFAICLAAVGRRWGLLGASGRRWLGGVFLASESTENLGPFFQGVVRSVTRYNFVSMRVLRYYVLKVRDVTTLNFKIRGLINFLTI